MSLSLHFLFLNTIESNMERDLANTQAQASNGLLDLTMFHRRGHCGLARCVEAESASRSSENPVISS